jgi:hypothetical protein
MTTAPAPIIAPSPMVTPHRMACDPIDARWHTRVPPHTVVTGVPARIIGDRKGLKCYC